MKKKIGILKGAESVMKIKNKKVGVLLFHGFNANPSQLTYLAEKLYLAGFSISIPRLPGHGTTIDEILKTDLHDWLQASREAYIELNARCDDVYIVGFSMGGFIALLLAKEFNPDKLVLISVAHKIKDFRSNFAFLMSLFKKTFQRKEKFSINCPEGREKYIKAAETPTRQAWYFMKLLKLGIKVLPEVFSKVLIVQSESDEIVPVESATFIYDTIGSEEKEKIMYERSNHIIPLDYDKDDLAKKVIKFFKQK